MLQTPPDERINVPVAGLPAATFPTVWCTLRPFGGFSVPERGRAIVTSEDSADPAPAETPDSSGSAGEDSDDGGRNARPLVAGAVGLLAGVAGGIVGTTIAPENLFLTVLLVVVVVLSVTFAVLHALSR